MKKQIVSISKLIKLYHQEQGSKISNSSPPLTVNNDLLLELNKYLLICIGLADHLQKLAGITKEEEKPSDDDDSDSDGIKSPPEVGPFSQRDSCLSLAFILLY